ncbi:MAG: tyrosine-type recombinase/integrase [Sedimentisphaerales bacterium]|nr:tyrosine-type recombinase/integrase [Sedimentisphaerales bacterium]
MKIFKNGKKYYLDFRFRDRRFRLTAFEAEKQSKRLGDTIERLMDIYHSNDCISLEIQRAVDCMPSRIVRKIESIGLLSAARTAGKNRLEDYIVGFIDNLRVKRSTGKYLSQVESMIKRICQRCRFNVISDLDANRFTAFVNGLNITVKTKSHYISAFKEFANWLHETGRLPKNNFKLIKTPKALQSDQVHSRRALTADEVARLIRAAQTGKPFRGISGAERALIYRIAVESGLRFNEVKTLKVSDFDFVNGTVQIRDANEKARRGVVLPLRKSTADMIKTFLWNKTPQSTAFTLKKGYLMIKTDLEAAGIPYEVDGKYADFHSLRHSTASLLIQTGANPKVIQSLMRHTDLNLTMSKYTHLYAGQQRGTIERLPDFTVQQDKAIKTGTYDYVSKNQTKEYCLKTANQSEKFRTNPNNSCNVKTTRNTALNTVNRKEVPFSGDESIPPFLTQKIGATGLEPATS